MVVTFRIPHSAIPHFTDTPLAQLDYYCQKFHHISYLWQRFSGTEIVDFDIVWIRHLHCLQFHIKITEKLHSKH